MFRVMLIDDEPLALEGLKTLINWTALGFTVVAECGDGAEAISRMKSAAPDLVVTDIYMPVMDGIALMSNLRSRGFDGEFLIVSGYGEFEKAREALRMGASGYILKPVDSDEAVSAITTARERIIFRKLKNENDGCSPEYRRTIISALTGGSVSFGSLPTGGEWRLLAWGSALSVEHAAAMYDSIKRFHALGHIFVHDEREMMLLHSYDNIQSAANAVISIAESAGREVALASASSPEGLMTAYAGLCASLDSKWALIAEKLKDMERLASLRHSADYKALCGEVLSACHSHGGFAVSRVSELWYSRCVRLLESSPEKLKAFTREFTNRQDIIAMGLTVIKLLAPDEDCLSDSVIRVLKTRYSENITLDGLAASMGYNPAYLGRVFRDETGVTFRAWLTDYRMKQAAEMLEKTDRSAQSIAVSVGFYKYANFLEHFKFAFGMSPDVYRRSRR